jgi:quercetin dioxygenase-like cupin family protein
MKRMAALSLSMWVACGSLIAQEAAVRSLLSKDLLVGSGKEVTLIMVEYPPGGSDPVHTHHAQALVYVLEGSIEMQVKGGPLVKLSAGQTFYEGPDDVHVVGRNASRSAPARFVVFLVKDKGAPLLTPVR